MRQADKETVLRELAGIQRKIVRTQSELLDVSLRIVNLTSLVMNTPADPPVVGAKAAEIMETGEADLSEDDDDETPSDDSAEGPAEPAKGPSGPASGTGRVGSDDRTKTASSDSEASSDAG